MPIGMPGNESRQAALDDDRWKFFFIRLFMKFGMKNPYEEKKPVFSPELLKGKADEIRTVKSRCDLSVLQLRHTVGELEKLWENEIQSSYIAELGSVRGALADYSDLLEEFAGFLAFAAAELASKPAAVKEYARFAEENDAPVPVALTGIPDLARRRDDDVPDTAFGISNAPVGAPGSVHAGPSKSSSKPFAGFLSKLGLRAGGGESATQRMVKLMKSRSLELRSVTNKYNFNVRKMQYAVEDLQKLWENDIQTKLIEELNILENPVKDFSNLMDEYATLLDMAVQELEASGTALDRASVLSKPGGGPVSLVLSDISYLKKSRINLRAYDPYFERTQAGVSTVVTASRKNTQFIYNVYEDHIELVKYIGMYRSVEVPPEIDGLPVTHIGLDCFAMSWRVRFVSVTLPDTVTTIYHGAFRNCQYIREFRLPKSLRYIGNYAFAFIQDLEHIEIPEGVVSLGMGAFRNCDQLRAAVIPDSVLRVGNDCFYCCRNLGRAVIGDGVVDIDDWAFRMCEHLESVTIGSGVVNIGESAFYDDVLLTRLDIPENVAKIGEHAFYHRRGMTLGVVAGSFAEGFARENNLKYVLK